MDRFVFPRFFFNYFFSFSYWKFVGNVETLKTRAGHVETSTRDWNQSKEVPLLCSCTGETIYEW